MTVALVMGGAKCVYDDIDNAIKMFKPDVFVAVKDIGIEYPSVDHWVTYHPERISEELKSRRSLGWPDPTYVWTYQTAPGVLHFPLPIQRIDLRGGSSGLLGTLVGLRYADKVVLAGIPMDPDMPHYHRRKNGKPWREALMYHKQWLERQTTFDGRVKSMSGWTKKQFGAPTLDWLGVK